MSADQLCALDADAAIRAFDDASLSPVELMSAVIARAEATEPHVNAFTETYFEQAMTRAREAEQRYRRGEARPLEGIPLAMKEEFRVAGTRRSSASLVYEDRVDDETDELPRRLLDAGAIMHAKTATPEFCLIGSCHSRLWGVTRNPWNLEMTPGGSSGGSAAALAAGSAVLATGTDIGGSIRIPASLCGVAGYKPPYGRNPEITPFNLDFYSHSGPLARSVADIVRMQNVTAGPHNRDIASLRPRLRLERRAPHDLRGWKIAWSMDLGFFEIDANVRANTLAALDAFGQLGASVTEVDIGWDASIVDAVRHYWAHGWAASLAELLEPERARLCDYTVWFLENALDSTRRDYFESLQTAVKMYDRFGPLLDEYDLFVCPTLTTTAVPADFRWPKGPVGINGRTESMDEERWQCTFPFNMLSRCPVISMPSGIAANNVPTGIQLVARSYDDQRVVDAAVAFERAFAFIPPAFDPAIGI